jgi:molybdopterin synthase catalytic subunit
MIAVAAGHRAECLQACSWLIDELKREVAIWKKDVFADGFVAWVEPNANPDRGQIEPMWPDSKYTEE